MPRNSNQGDIRVWTFTRNPLAGPLVKSSSLRFLYHAKLIIIWNRFSFEATYTISYRFLREATGPGPNHDTRKYENTCENNQWIFFHCTALVPLILAYYFYLKDPLRIMCKQVSLSVYFMRKPISSP